MIGSWVCLACPESGSGSVTKVEQASRLHSKKAGHATATALGGATGPLDALQGSSGTGGQRVADRPADRATATKENP